MKTSPFPTSQRERDPGILWDLDAFERPIAVVRTPAIGGAIDETHTLEIFYVMEI